MSRIEPRHFSSETGADLLIRTAGIADAAALLDLARQIMAEREFTLTEWDETSRTVESEQQWIQRAIDHPGDHVLVAEIPGELVGILDFRQRRKRKVAHSGEFGMSVVTQRRDQGIGRALLTTLLDWATAHPALEKIDLGVFATNARAIHLYDSFGFREEGRQIKAIKFADGHYDDLVLMSRSLKPAAPRQSANSAGPNARRPS